MALQLGQRCQQSFCLEDLASTVEPVPCLEADSSSLRRHAAQLCIFVQKACVSDRQSFAGNCLLCMPIPFHTPAVIVTPSACMLQGLSPGRRPALGGEVPPASLRAYYCVLGHLYAAARLELMQMAATLQMEADLTSSHMRQHVSGLP